ncbi:hypothetical protein D1B33_07380 [Lysinibacillus yapensis]|uniref:CopG family transcriptional regulator n=1 Tax=Ureibacillus yapensis TaxID=2304605 RepID=A0A396SHY4_9BACL|nr:hypothetical protein [Lysinibacillus yapensis]RHW38687.1 hypothetical protein D1B33_07380 [Lysinibacillus yapensis]
MSDRKIVPISISLTDETEITLLNHLNKRSNRSKYIKKLIYDDLMNVKNVLTSTTHYVEQEINEDLESMKGFF